MKYFVQLIFQGWEPKITPSPNMEVIWELNGLDTLVFRAPVKEIWALSEQYTITVFYV